MTISMIWSCRSVLPSQNRDAHLFHVEKKHEFSWFLCALNNFMVLGPRPLGPMGPFVFLHFLKICFMVWDLSRSVPMVFRSPGNPLIKLFHLSFNSKCHVLKVFYWIAYWIAYCIAYWIANWNAYWNLLWQLTRCLILSRASLDELGDGLGDRGGTAEEDDAAP